jgi:phosphatidylglycerophosphate synthase
MVSVYELKPRFQELLRPLVRHLARTGVTPNHVTLAALAGSCAVGALAWCGIDRRIVFAVIPAWLFARMALNAIDGMLAREHALTSNLGAILNEVGDVVSDVALYLPLGVLVPEAFWSALAFAFAGVLTEVVGIHAQALGAGRRYDGPMGKSDRAFVAGALALVAAFAPGTTIAWSWILAVAAFLGLVTCVRRARRALDTLSARKA